MKTRKWFQKNGVWIAIIVMIIIFAVAIQVNVVDKDKPKIKELGTPTSHGYVPPQWYPDDITVQIYEALEGFDSQTLKEATWAKFNMLNDNQMIMVYNDFNDKYSDKRSWGQKFGTMLQALKDEWWNGKEATKAIANMERLKFV